MPDYFCWPIWHDGGGDVGPVDPSSLSLSPKLVEEFGHWQDEYDRSLDLSDPAASPGLVDPDRFEQEGRRLARELQRELGADHEVRYWLDSR